MKKISLFIICLVSVSFAFAHSIKKSSVPAKVLAYVEKHYPKALSVDWDFEEDDNLYEAEFTIDGLDYKLELTPEGVLKYSKEDVKIADIPQAIIQSIQKEYKGYKVLGANKLFKKGKYLYDVGIKGKNEAGYTRHYNLYFDVKGNALSKGRYRR